MKKFLKGLILVFAIVGLVACAEETVKEEEPKEEIIKEEPKQEPVKDEGISKEEQEYASKVTDILDSSSSALDAFSTLFTDASIDPTLLLDEQWKTAVVAVFQIFEIDYNTLQSMEVPPRMQVSHDLTVESFRLLLESKQHIYDGVDNFDVEALGRGTELINQSTAKMNEAGIEMDKLIAESF